MTAQRRERDAFLSAAAEVCRLCEDGAQLGGERLMVALDLALPRLHTAAVDLPYPDDTDEMPDDDLDIDVEEETARVRASLDSVMKELRWDIVRDDLDEGVPTADEVIDKLDRTFDRLGQAGSEAAPTRPSEIGSARTFVGSFLGTPARTAGGDRLRRHPARGPG